MKYNCKPPTLRKLFNAYYRAHSELSKRRDAEYPVGTLVKSPVFGHAVSVSGGSLYADQINTTVGHMSWPFAEKVAMKHNTVEGEEV